MPINGGAQGGWKNPSSDEIKKLLQKSKTIAVVGLSSNPARASNRIAGFLIEKGYRVIPVNPKEKSVLGQKAYPDLRSIPDKIDIVDVFRNPSIVPDIVEAAVACKVGAVWLQENVVSTEAFSRGERAGLMMVMDRCIFKEHRRLFND